MSESCLFPFHLSESCFHSALTHPKPPLFCQQGYLNQRGVPRSNQLRERVHSAGLWPAEQEAAGASTAGASTAGSTFPHYLAPAGAAVSSGLKLDFWLSDLFKWCHAVYFSIDCYLLHKKYFLLNTKYWTGILFLVLVNLSQCFCNTQQLILTIFSFCASLPLG